MCILFLCSVFASLHWCVVQLYNVVVQCWFHDFWTTRRYCKEGGGKFWIFFNAVYKLIPLLFIKQNGYKKNKNGYIRFTIIQGQSIFVYFNAPNVLPCRLYQMIKLILHESRGSKSLRPVGTSRPHYSRFLRKFQSIKRSKPVIEHQIFYDEISYGEFPLSITRFYVQQCCIPNMILLKLLQHRSLPPAFKCSDYVGKFSLLTHIQTTKICTFSIKQGNSFRS